MYKIFTFIVLSFISNLAFSTGANAQSTTATYSWKNVQMQGGGFVTGIVYSPTERDLVYARTDVGGAYRWDAATQTWIPLTDHLSRSEQDYTGVLSLATDPSDLNRVYIAAGLYTQSWAGTGAILRSMDRGNTWSHTNLTIKLGGNENGRSAGERLQVDSNLGSTLYLGSSTDGLWKSADYGASWSKVNSFPVATSPIGSGGISFVLLDKASGKVGSATPTIYVGVLQTGTNLYKSTDGGGTWTAVPNQITNYMPHQAALAADGTLYLTYSNGPGPNGVTEGAVRKLNTTTGVWTTINPPTGQGGYAGLALDPQQPGTLLVSTLNRWWPRDEVYRSTDGGASWKGLLTTATWDHTLAPYAANSNPHWIGDVAIDPFDSNNSWFVTGYGVYNSTNLAAADRAEPVLWSFQNKGLEETVPLKLISPPTGAPLVSALGDIDGFKHDDLDVSPAAGRLSPRYGTNTSIDFAELLPAHMARIHYNADGKYGAYSTDGGTTWTAFGSAPAGSTGGGTIAVAADGSTLVWAPGGATGLYYSRNSGATWAGATGTSKRELKPVSDRVNAQKFYAYDAEAGSVLVSINGGASFSAAATGLPRVPSWQFWAAALYPVFGHERDIWLTNPTASGGLYRSTDSGASFTKLTNVQEAVKVGFGKAAKGSTYPAVYMAGKVNNTEGFFRSDDAGASWVRINDEQHQFGGVNDITGDRHVYGRLYVATGGRGILYGDDQGVVSGFGKNRNNTMQVSYFPNPFSESLQIVDAPFSAYSIVTLHGTELEFGTCEGGCTVGENLKPGIYLLTIRSKSQNRTIKIIKD